MDNNNWEPSAMEKLHMEKGGGAIGNGNVTKRNLKKGTRIQVKVKVGDEETVYDLETLFLVGIDSLKKTADGTYGKAGTNIQISGCLDAHHVLAIVDGIETAKTKHKGIMMADMIRMMESVSESRNPLEGVLGELGDILGGDDE